jgi:hypothetical protein
MQTKEKAPDFSGALSFHFGKTGLAARNLPRRHKAEHEEDQEDHQEDPEQQLGDREGRASNAAETQNGGNKAQNQKKNGETQHGVSSK